MTPEIYRACFTELHKEAGIIGNAARSAATFGADVGRATAETFDPRVWREGVTALRQGAVNSGANIYRAGSRGERALTVAGTGLGTVSTAMDAEDPSTGRHRGIAERGLRATAALGSGLIGHRYSNHSFLRGMGISLGSNMLTDAMAERVGRNIDEPISFARDLARSRQSLAQPRAVPVGVTP